MRDYFNPIAQGRRLRAALAHLTPSQEPLPSYSDELLITLREGRRLITPEGRVVLWCLQRASQAGGMVVIDPSLLAEGERALLAIYRSWVQQRIRGVANLTADAGPALHPLGLGMLLFLLMNRSTSERRALRRSPSGADDDSRRRFQALDNAIADVVSAFVDGLVPGRKYDRRQISLRSGWQLTEARRRLAASLSDSPDEIYVKEGEDDRVTEFVGRELRRRDITRARFEESFDAMAARYRERLPALAKLGLAFGRPIETRQLREAVARRLE